MRRTLMVVVIVLTIAAGIVAATGCGKGKDLSGIYENSNMTLTLLSDGTATLEIPPVPEIGLEGETRPGEYSFDGKELKIQFSDVEGNDLTYKVAGDDLVSTSVATEGAVWKKQ